ncbi:hypothetical protein OUZ56_016995 [Daphnia magna]|uniref:Uncharacterized protein n=1 Tax=Daphnia magna TaxID=35525 RepID=A0ABR0ARY2_9CRUS|nr:hypothetical protein OUZ56_016995 [Daphnia magna]
MSARSADTGSDAKIRAPYSVLLRIMALYVRINRGIGRQFLPKIPVQLLVKDDVWNSISSANKERSHPAGGRGKSCIMILNRVGLRKLPFGTLVYMIFSSDRRPSIHV